MSDTTEPVVESAPAEPVVDATIETPVVSEPAVPEVAAASSGADEPTEATEATEAVASTDPYEEFGGREYVERAKRMYDASQSEDGVIQLFLEAGASLGLGLKEMQAIFEGGEATPTEPVEPPDPDEPITRGEWEAFQRQQQETTQQAAARQATEVAKKTIQATVTRLGLDPEDPATQVVLQMGDKYFDQTDLSPEKITAAIERGHADYQVLVEKEATKYLEKKRAQAATVPSAPSGSSAPAATDTEEPADVAAAIKAVRRKLGMTSA